MRAFNSYDRAIMARGLNCGPEPDTVSYLIKRANAEVVEVPVKMAERFAGERWKRRTSAKYVLDVRLDFVHAVCPKAYWW